MSNFQLRLCALIIFILVILVPALIPGSVPVETMDVPEQVESIKLQVSVDGRDLPRGLLHSSITVPVSAGAHYFWYPKWIPGIHAPRGAIQNMAGLVITTNQGQTLKWQRDPGDVCRFLVQVPDGTSIIHIDFDYICNQPSTNSIGVDSFGNRTHAVISWNNVLMYPEAFDNEHTIIEATLTLPDEWKSFTALPLQAGKDSTYTFSPSCLRQVIDSPIICGRNYQSHQLQSDGKEVWLHVVGSTESSIVCSDEVLDGMRGLVSEARLLFGHEHYPYYHFLLVTSNDFPRLGLEHLSSSLNGVNATDLPTGGFGATRVMSHEYVHSWCGKYRRPAGMFTSTYHHNKDTTMLWVYEGLTQYLGNILSVRAGLRSETDFHELLHYYLSSLRTVNGRHWRSLADTATASYLLRGGSDNWEKWLRGQDYYIEGALIWFEVDCLIRHRTNGEKSLDDFCKIFLGKNPDQSAVNPYSYADILVILNDLVVFDWDAFFQKRVYQEHQEYDMALFQHSGWEVSFDEFPDANETDKAYYYRNAYESIGVGFSKSGRVYRVLKDSPGYIGGLAKGMQVGYINNRPFSPAVLHQALIDAKENRTLILTVDNGESIQKMTINYQDGPRYLVLKRNEDQADAIHAILSPQREQD